MEEFDQFLLNVKDFVWGPPLLILLIGTGLYLTIILKGVQFRYLGYAFKQVFATQKKEAAGDITPFESLMTSLAGAIGTGSIVGVATAMTLGGVGSLFWMWLTAFVGMATKYAESLLAVKYRVLDEKGEISGGPMQYIERGLGWKWMAIIFAIFGAIAAIGTGNLVQVNAISESIFQVWHIDLWYTGLGIAFITGLVIMGGVSSIGQVAGVLVPLMALFYMAGGLIILIKNYATIPHALLFILKSAFTGQAAAGGFAGSTIMMAIQLGVSRSVFSNEAGLGISTIAAAAAKTDSPSRQALITMTGALLSTVVVCSMTGLVIAVTEMLGKTTSNGEVMTGASLAIWSFSSAIYLGEYIVSIGLILFAFSTVIAWAYYGEKCFEYLFGERFVIAYRLLFTAIIIPGAAIKMERAWVLADIMNGLMVIPNLIAVIALSRVIVGETTIFLESVRNEEKSQAKS